MKYPWQQAVLDAFGASAEDLPTKISIAEKAIAARLRDTHQPDSFERLALNEALHDLGKLLPENPDAHFHICWANGTLDWERHKTRLSAEAAAKQLARPGEAYTVEERDGDCERCRGRIKEKLHG